MPDVITDIDALESTVGTRPPAVMMKSIGHLDDHCEAIVARAVGAVVTHVGADGAVRAGVVGGTPGFAGCATTSRLALRLPADAVDGAPVAAVVLVPGWRETLRVNGRVVAGEGIAVEEAFLHCGKAIIRSGLWDQPPPSAPGGPVGTADRVEASHRRFLAAAPFAVVGSCDAAGDADASPKGDPAGFVHVVDDRTVALPDRPGNRRTDTFHNVVEQPDVAVLALCPGDDRVLEVRGRARLSTDAALVDAMAVAGRAPAVALVVDVTHAALVRSVALQDDGLWDAAHHVTRDDLPRPARIWTDHVKQDETEGPAAQAIRTGVDEAAIHAGVAADYERNLY